MATSLVCYDCGRSYDPPRKRCDCGEPLWFDVDASGFAWPEGREPSLWRYADLIPTSPPPGLGAAVGGTPLFRAERLDDYAGCRLSVKAEGTLPTGSFKDRGSAVGVAGASGWVGTVSHGNMAMSTAAFAAAAGLGCVVLVPDDIPEARLEHIAAYGPRIVRVEGDYGRLYYETLDLEAELGVSFVNSDAPLRVAGQKTVALEIVEALAPETPDGIALPLSSGGHASAVWKALLELEAAGLIDDIPRLYLVQAAATDPIAAAYREGRDEVTAVEKEPTVAYSIGNPDPPSGNRALRAARETGGAVTSATDDEMLEAQTRVAADAGLSIEPASAAAVAGTRRLVEEGEIDPGDRIVAVATGTGFKEGIDATVEAPTVRLDDLGGRLADLLG